MSLYGNIKKVDSSVFQFDKIYPNRAELEDNEENDGVYTGRYVLIEYGQRWIDVQLEPNENTEYGDTYATINGIRVKERLEYRTNANKDLTRFGAIYDSTVWQKIYFQGQDKYIMVAELNAIAPKLDMQQHDPVTYVKNNSNLDPEDGILAGKYDKDTKNLEIVRLVNATEKYNEGYFDNAMDTEISYLLHYPKNLQIEAGDNTINYNQHGFNAMYSYGEEDGPSTIALVPKVEDDYVILKENDNITPQKDPNGHYLAELKHDINVDTKTLFINFPSFGNAMNTIYNLIYGVPTENTQDLKNGILRPYFKQFLRNINFTNTVMVKDATGELKPLTINRIPERVEGPLEIYVAETNSWEPVVKEFHYTNLNDINNKTIEPSFIKVKFKDNNGNIYDTKDDNLSGVYILYNELLGQEFTWTMQPPTGEDNFIQSNLDNIPILKDLSKVNSAGLASILQDLFGVKDPITGLARYFLYNDWTVNSNGEDSTPMILNKPYVVGGYQENYNYIELRLKQLDDDGNVREGADRQYQVLQITTSPTFSGGHYTIDFNTWQLKAV